MSSSLNIDNITAIILFYYQCCRRKKYKLLLIRIFTKYKQHICQDIWCIFKLDTYRYLYGMS